MKKLIPLLMLVFIFASCEKNEVIEPTSTSAMNLVDTSSQSSSAIIDNGVFNDHLEGTWNISIVGWYSPTQGWLSGGDGGIAIVTDNTIECLWEFGNVTYEYEITSDASNTPGWGYMYCDGDTAGSCGQQYTYSYDFSTEQPSFITKFPSDQVTWAPADVCYIAWTLTKQ